MKTKSKAGANADKNRSASPCAAAMRLLHPARCFAGARAGEVAPGVAAIAALSRAAILAAIHASISTEFHALARMPIFTGIGNSNVEIRR